MKIYLINHEAHNCYNHATGDVVARLNDVEHTFLCQNLWAMNDVKCVLFKMLNQYPVLQCCDVDVHLVLRLSMHMGGYATMHIQYRHNDFVD